MEIGLLPLPRNVACAFQVAGRVPSYVERGQLQHQVMTASASNSVPEVRFVYQSFAGACLPYLEVP